MAVSLTFIVCWYATVASGVLHHIVNVDIGGLSPYNDTAAIWAGVIVEGGAIVAKQAAVQNTTAGSYSMVVMTTRRDVSFWLASERMLQFSALISSDAVWSTVPDDPSFADTNHNVKPVTANFPVVPGTGTCADVRQAQITGVWEAE